MWDVAEVYVAEPFAYGASDDVKSLATSLTAPYCGVNAGFEAVQWLEDPEAAASLVLLPLRANAGAPAFGLLVLASPDGARYQAGMATDFLERIAETAELRAKMRQFFTETGIYTAKQKKSKSKKEISAIELVGISGSGLFFFLI